jgi:hypothetical protein
MKLTPRALFVYALVVGAIACVVVFMVSGGCFAVDCSQ